MVRPRVGSRGPARTGSDVTGSGATSRRVVIGGRVELHQRDVERLGHVVGGSSERQVGRQDQDGAGGGRYEADSRQYRVQSIVGATVGVRACALQPASGSAVADSNGGQQ